MIELRLDHSVSPDNCLNTARLNFRGASEWLSLEILVGWRDLSLAENFQFSFYARPSRSLAAEALLRLPKKNESLLDLSLANFTLHPDERNIVVSGQLKMPDFIELDTRQHPLLIISFDTEGELSVLFEYINAYFG